MQAGGLITFVKSDAELRKVDPASLKSLGERVAWARVKRELSQPQLAKRAGVSQGAIGNLESGTRKTSRSLVAIANALRASVEWLDSGKGNWEAAKGTVFDEPTKDEWKLLNEYRALLDKDRKKFAEEIATKAKETQELHDEFLARFGVASASERRRARQANVASAPTLSPEERRARKKEPELPFDAEEDE
jgi:transcriptional regulator with XRE-family HTH domain